MAQHIGIIGSGLIGKSWAMLFVAQVQNAIDDILKQLHALEEIGMLRGNLSVKEQHALISPANSLQDCVVGAKYIQECTPEILEVKRAIFEEMDKFVEGKTILASSTSSMPASTFTAHLKNKSQCIVAHPVNPPFYCPLVEVVPAPYTEPWVTQATKDLMAQLEQAPVLLKREVPGFALNRLQYSLLNECWRLVQDDVISGEDIDTVMTEGLGMRYAFCGPFEVIHMNAEGTENYCERYGSMINGISQDFGPIPDLTDPSRKKIVKESESRFPLDQLTERRKLRDSKLIALAKIKKEFKK